MKTKLRHIARVALVAGLFVLGLGVCKQAQAAPNPDTMTVYVTPSGLTYAVTITSPAVAVPAYNFGAVTLGQTTISTKAIAVANTGTVGEYFALKVSNTAPDNWAPLAADGTPGNNQFELLSHFVATAGGQPADATFSGANDIVNSGYISSSGNKFGLGAGLIPPTGGTATKDLYLKLIMPSSVSSPSQQSFTVTINGQAT